MITTVMTNSFIDHIFLYNFFFPSFHVERDGWGDLEFPYLCFIIEKRQESNNSCESNIAIFFCSLHYILDYSHLIIFLFHPTIKHTYFTF